MAKIFKDRFCEITKIKVCATSEELNFDSYTEPGTYEIYEDMGSGQSRIYFLTVDKSATGACIKQTRVYCGKVEVREVDSTGTWTAWKAVIGVGNIEDGDGEVSLTQKTYSAVSKNSAPGKAAASFGAYNEAKAKASMAVNYDNEVNAPNAFAANSANIIEETAAGAFVAGHQNKAINEHEAVFGTYSDPQEGALFTIGVGQSEDDRRNILVVYPDGRFEILSGVRISGNTRVNGTFTSDGSIECLGYFVRADKLIAHSVVESPKVTTKNLIVTGEINSSAYNTVVGGPFQVKGSIGSSGNILSTGGYCRGQTVWAIQELKINNTTINETQLKKLLALID